MRECCQEEVPIQLLLAIPASPQHYHYYPASHTNTARAHIHKQITPRRSHQPITLLPTPERQKALQRSLLHKKIVATVVSLVHIFSSKECNYIFIAVGNFSHNDEQQ
jgi:hypothetical protein